MFILQSFLLRCRPFSLKCEYHLWVFSFLESTDTYSKRKFGFGFFFVTQLAFKQEKFYFPSKNDCAKGRMGPSWAVTSFTD